jgi:hypothetical protein
MYFTTCIASSGTRLRVGQQLTRNLRLVPKHRLDGAGLIPFDLGIILATYT